MPEPSSSSCRRSFGLHRGPPADRDGAGLDPGAHPVPLEVGHQVGVPYHWGGEGISTGDSGNDLTGVVMDPNVHIQESKAATCDVRPGRRPRGPALVDYVEGYRQRAGVKTGIVPVGGRVGVETSTGDQSPGS